MPYRKQRVTMPLEVPAGVHPPVNSTAEARASLSTPTLLNEAYTRVRATARAYEHACGATELGALHTWMRSYGRRLNAIAEQLQDEGARIVKRLDTLADEIFDDDICKSPRTLLAEAELVQRDLVVSFEQLTERLDMDAELYDLLTEDYDELGEALLDIGMLKREYETYLRKEVGSTGAVGS